MASAYLDRVLADPAVPPELRPFYERFQALHAKKLWYQLTQQLEAFLRHPASQHGRCHIELYDEFICTFAKHLNYLKVASFGVIVSRQYADASEALAFLERLRAAAEADEHQQDALVLLTMEAAHFQLLLNDLPKARAAMDTCARLLDSFDTVEPVVYASYYRVCGDYYKARAEYAEYYRHYLLFLACIHLETEMSAAEQVQCAHDLGLSALLGDTIYHFGELLLHPILTSLHGTEHAWISELLYAFNAGDLGRFEALRPRFTQEPMLEASLPFLRQKICLMALMESVFRRGTQNRTLSFATIASETRIPVDEVEHLVMKALALHLIRGSIDQVDELVRVTWVQPRVLDTQQTQALLERLTAWTAKVDQVAAFVQAQSPELFTTAFS